MKCAEVYRIFFNPGEVTEIRAYGLSKTNRAWEGWAGGAGIVYGYFDNARDFGKAAEALEEAKAPGIYFTLNPVIPDLLARAANRLKAADAKSKSTTDQEVLVIRWLPIDLDPVRPSGISSTDEELQAAMKCAERIRKFMAKRGAKKCVKACSGNGAHLVYRLKDRPNSQETVDQIKRILAALAHRFTDEQVEVDQKVFNPSRIWKLYGTTSRKGDHTPARPHRKSYIIA